MTIGQQAVKAAWAHYKRTIARLRFKPSRPRLPQRASSGCRASPGSQTLRGASTRVTSSAWTARTGLSHTSTPPLLSLTMPQASRWCTAGNEHMEGAPRRDVMPGSCLAIMRYPRSHGSACAGIAEWRTSSCVVG